MSIGIRDRSGEDSPWVTMSIDFRREAAIFDNLPVGPGLVLFCSVGIIEDADLRSYRIGVINSLTDGVSKNSRLSYRVSKPLTVETRISSHLWGDQEVVCSADEQ